MGKPFLGFSKRLWETGVVPVSHNCGISTVWFYRLPGFIVPGNFMGAIADAGRMIGILMYDGLASGESRFTSLAVDPERHIPVPDRIVPIDCPFSLDRENAVEIVAAAFRKIRTLLQFAQLQNVG